MRGWDCSAARSVGTGVLLLTGLVNGVMAQGTGSVEPVEAEGDGEAPLSLALIPPEQAEQEAFVPAERADPFNFYAGVDFVSMYVSRGQVYSSKFSVQPWFEVDVPLAKGESAGPFDSVSVFGGNWNSIQEGDAGLGQARSGERRLVDNWYESDLYAGVRVSKGSFNSSFRVNYYTSPSESFEDIVELDWRLAYDDSHWWGEDSRFSLNPSLRIAKEVYDRPGTERWFFRPQLEPSYRFRVGDQPVTATVPIVLGFGADGHYVTPDGDEEHFGYFQTGLRFSGPLDILPEGSGSLKWSAGVDVIIVSDEALNFRGDKVNPVGTFGVSYSY